MRSLRALGALLNFEFDFLTLFQGLVPFHFYRGVVCEDIVAAVRGCDESITLAGVKPLYRTEWHTSPFYRGHGRFLVADTAPTLQRLGKGAAGS